MVNHTPARPLVVVSACLLGRPVRYDAGHCRTSFLVDDLASHVDFVAVCPEQAAGMPTPREAVRLVQDGESTRLVGNRSGTDWTGAMQEESDRMIDALEERMPAAFVLKKGSPSCGVFRVRRYDAAGNRLPANGAGLFAQRALHRFGDVVIEEDGRLHDPGLRHQFLVRLFAAHRVQSLLEPGTTRNDVMRFQQREKLLLMAHAPAAQKQLGRLIANASGPTPALARQYRQEFLRALAQPTHTGRVVNVLQHMAGYFRDHLDPTDRAELTDEIKGFEVGARSIASVAALIRHHARRHDVRYLLDQTVLEPYPAQLLTPRPDPHFARPAERTHRNSA